MTVLNEPLALYIHWPWCLSKCPYCDFNSYAITSNGPRHTAYRNAIISELKHYATITGKRPLGSIFFGGGTPSLMKPSVVADIIACAKKLWRVSNTCEITLEANPTSIETARFRAYKDAGVNRVSIGVQSLRDDALHALGREHSVDDALQALGIAGAIFERFSFDMIYARPNQSLEDWRTELHEALKLANGHISLYQLTIEPGTEFFRTHVHEADEGLAADLYTLTQEMTDQVGLPAYEISNHARPHQQSRHNLTYWTGGDYIGVGPGAHGRLTITKAGRNAAATATHQIADCTRWLDAVANQGHGTAKTRILSATARAEELLLTGLRLSDGINRVRFETLIGQDVTAVVNAENLALLQETSLVLLSDSTLRLSTQGRLTLNAVLEKLLT